MCHIIVCLRVTEAFISQIPIHPVVTRMQPLLVGTRRQYAAPNPSSSINHQFQSLNIKISDPRFELFSGSLVLLSSLAYALNTLPSLTHNQMQGLNMFETGISVFFLVEYFLRFLANDGNRLKFVSSPLALIDLASFLPALINLIMPGLTSGYTALELLRLLRILRLQRFLQEDEFFKIEELLKIEASIVQLKFARVFSSLFTLLFISTGLIYSCEHTVNPAFSDFFTTLYFGLCTLTTVGFGDIVPITFEGRLVVCASILVGIGVIPLQVGELVSERSERARASNTIH